MSSKLFITVFFGVLAYWFLYDSPEKSYGEYTGTEQRAPSLRGNEVIGHMRIYLSRRSYSAGHGFVLDHETKQYVVSAGHIVNDLKNVDSVDVVLGSSVLVADAKPALGSSQRTCNMEDARRDVTFYAVKDSSVRGSLSIQGEPPKSGQHVWLMCTEHSSGENKVLVPAIVTASSNRALKYNFLSQVNFQGSSGCPIVDSNKRLVGVNVCGHADAGVAVPIPSILDSLKSL